jgi:hypothetical protein
MVSGMKGRAAGSNIHSGKVAVKADDGDAAEARLGTVVRAAGVGNVDKSPGRGVAQRSRVPRYERPKAAANASTIIMKWRGKLVARE